MTETHGSLKIYIPISVLNLSTVPLWYTDHRAINEKNIEFTYNVDVYHLWKRCKWDAINEKSCYLICRKKVHLISMVTDRKVTWKYQKTFLRKQGESPGSPHFRVVPPISAKCFLGARKVRFHPRVLIYSRSNNPVECVTQSAWRVRTTKSWCAPPPQPQMEVCVTSRHVWEKRRLAPGGGPRGNQEHRGGQPPPPVRCVWYRGV